MRITVELLGRSVSRVVPDGLPSAEAADVLRRLLQEQRGEGSFLTLESELGRVGGLRSDPDGG